MKIRRIRIWRTSGGSEMKTLVFWIGLILVGFGILVSFIALWIYLSTVVHIFRRFGGVGILAILFFGALISIVIGWRMMKEE